MFCLDHHDPRRQGVLKLSTQDAGLSLEAQPSTLVESLSHRAPGTPGDWSPPARTPHKGCGGRANFADAPESTDALSQFLQPAAREDEMI